MTSSTDAAEILKAVRSLVLSQCCQAGTHRAKLEAELICRAALVKALLLRLAEEKLLQTVVLGTELDPEEGLDVDGVVKFHDPSTLVLADLLRSKVDLSPRSKGEKELPKFGVLYALSLPSLPKLIKIGYSGKTAESRRLEWMNCFPGATVLVECRIAYPERMEQLIHLQLAEQRRQIAKCKVCSKTHVELFEMTSDDAKQLLLEWQSLADQEPIYDGLQQLKSVYEVLLSKVTEDLTARVLLDMLVEHTVGAEVETIVKTELDMKKEVKAVISRKIELSSPDVPLRVKQETTKTATWPTQVVLSPDEKAKSNAVSSKPLHKRADQHPGVDTARQLTDEPAPASDLIRGVGDSKLDKKEVHIKIEVIELPSTIAQHDGDQAQPNDRGNRIAHLTERVAGVVIEQGDSAETTARRTRSVPVLKPVVLQDVKSTGRARARAY